MSFLRFHLLALLLTSAAQAADKVTYDDHIFPLFQQSCLNCHNPDKTKGGLDLSTYAGAMKGGSGGKIAEPGDPSSKIIQVCLQTAEPKMPPEGDKLAANQIALLKSWIEGGLLENKNSNARKPSKPKFETALRSDPAAKPEGPPPMPEDLRLEPFVLTPRASAVHTITASPWAPLLAITGQRQILLHDTQSLELVGILPFPEGDPVSLAFTPDSRHLIVGGGTPGKSGTTVTFEIRTGKRLLTAAKEFDSILAADIRPGFDIVATGGPSRLLKLWDTRSGQPIASIKKHTDWITALDISPDGILVASGDRNGGVWVWETQSGSEFHTLRAHQAAITAVAFRSDSNLLATASEDGTIRYWEMNGGSEVRKNDAHPGGVVAMCLDREGRTLSAGRDRKLRLWKPDFSLEKDLAKDLPALPTSVACSFDGSRAFISDAAGIVRVFDTKSGQSLGEFSAAPPSIESRLQQLTSLIQARPAKRAETEKTNAELQAKLEAARQEVNQAQANVQQAKATHEAAKKAEASRRHEHSTLQSQIAPRQSELDQAKAKLPELERELEAKQQALAALPEDQRRPADLITLETRRTELQQQLTRLNDELAGLQRQLQERAQELEKAVAATRQSAEAIPPSEATLKAKRDAVPAFEKEATAARTTLDSFDGETAQLETSRKRWTAAAINTQALQAAEQASALNEQREERILAFQDLAKRLNEQANTLNTKRQEREAFVTKREAAAKTTPAPPELAEMEATLTAIDANLRDLSSALAQSEKEFLTVRQELDQATAPLEQAFDQATRLRQTYLAAKP